LVILPFVFILFSIFFCFVFLCKYKYSFSYVVLVFQHLVVVNNLKNTFFYFRFFFSFFLQLLTYLLTEYTVECDRFAPPRLSGRLSSQLRKILSLYENSFLTRQVQKWKNLSSLYNGFFPFCNQLKHSGTIVSFKRS
jgi:hypothetical protein